jgi:PAS domain S-box-containing protein
MVQKSNYTADPSASAGDEFPKGSGEWLSDTEQLFRVFMENTPTLTWILDDQACFRYMNSSYMKTFGLSREAIGRSIYEFYPKELCDAYVKANRLVWDSNKPAELREKGIGADGGLLVLRVFKFPVGVENGVRLIGGTALDITQTEKLIEVEAYKKREIIKVIMEAQEKERKEISSELHDNVNQILTTCKLLLEIARNNPTDSARFIDGCYINIQNVIGEIRNISHNLTPYTLKDLGLAEAIYDLVEKINQSGKINISMIAFQDLDEGRINPDIKLAIFRIVQENINNVLKHSQATELKIRIKLDQNRVYLRLLDNGKGFDQKTVKKGLGLNNIQNRVDYYKGSMRLKTAPGKGCELNIELPCH